jgi:hypothetical protein
MPTAVSWFMSLDVLCRFANSKAFFQSLPRNVHDNVYDLNYGTEAPLQIRHLTLWRETEWTGHLSCSA